MGLPVTAFMPCFQQEKYVRQALQSLFAQTYSPLQILVIDNASTDRTFEIVQAEVAAYRGPHSVTVRKNDSNPGIETYNAIRSIASGRFIVEFHSDDVSDPNRVDALVSVATASGAWLVSSNFRVMDRDGRFVGLGFADDAAETISAERLADHGWSPGLLGATFGYVRDVLDRFEPLNRDRILMGHDTILPMRAAIGGGIRILRTPLLSYRRHPDAQTTRYVLGSRRDQEARRERIAYDRTMHCLAMLSAVDDAPVDLLSGSRRADLRGRLAKRLEKCAADWVAARNALHLAGRTCSWSMARADA